MTGPTPEARAAAMKACHSSIYGGYETVQAIVDAVWPFAVAQGRREAAADIEKEHTRIRPPELRGLGGLVDMATANAYSNAARIAMPPATGGIVKPGQAYVVGEERAPDV